MTFRERIRSLLLDLGGSQNRSFAVEPPSRPEHGDYATNIAVGDLARARDVSRELETRGADFISRASVAGPGFINVRLSDASLARGLQGILDHPDQWGRSEIGSGKTVRVEYFQLNIAKRPHIGHLRSAVIGDAIKRMLLAFGYHAVSDTHVGDWGTQFGILLMAYKERMAASGQRIEGDPLEAFERLYTEENERIAGDPNRRERAKEEFANLERGDVENRKIWEWMVDVSMDKLKEGAVALGLEPFDMHLGESFYEGAMAPIVERALQKGVAARTPDSAVIVDLTADDLDEAVLVKSDGASTYLLRDLATIQYAKQDLDFWRNLYVVDVRQAHHFRQVFRVAERLGFEGVGESRHIEFGFLSLPEGPMSTRAGTAISLELLIAEAKKRAGEVIREKNPTLNGDDFSQAIHAVGLGAIKYFDLSHHRRSDIAFRWEGALTFEGNTGPYLQYTHARLKSILRKASNDSRSANAAMVPEGMALDELEHRLLASALRLPEAIEDALEDYTPNTLANYLYHLAKLANEFYHSHPVTQEPDGATRAFRLALVAGVALTLANGLNLLGIEAPEEM